MNRIKARFVKCKDTPILEYFSPAFGRGSERARSSHSESCEGPTLQPSREGWEAAGRGLEAAGGKGGKTGELQAREEPAWEAQTGCFVRPGVCRWGRPSEPEVGAPRPPVGGPWIWRRRGGAWLSAPGAGPNPGAPGRCGPGWSTGTTGAPATKGCDPPLAPPSRLRPGQSEPLLLAGGPSRPSCSEALAW